MGRKSNKQKALEAEKIVEESDVFGSTEEELETDEIEFEPTEDDVMDEVDNEIEEFEKYEEEIKEKKLSPLQKLRADAKAKLKPKIVSVLE